MNPPWVTGCSAKLTIKLVDNNKMKQEHSEITVTTYYPGGRSRGGSVEALHHR